MKESERHIAYIYIIYTQSPAVLLFFSCCGAQWLLYSFFFGIARTSQKCDKKLTAECAPNERKMSKGKQTSTHSNWQASRQQKQQHHHHRGKAASTCRISHIVVVPFFDVAVVFFFCFFVSLSLSLLHIVQNEHPDGYRQNACSQRILCLTGIPISSTIMREYIYVALEIRA